jgi:hypothetical protein
MTTACIKLYMIKYVHFVRHIGYGTIPNREYFPKLEVQNIHCTGSYYYRLLLPPVYPTLLEK